MAVEIGTQLTHYQVTALIGEFATRPGLPLAADQRSVEPHTTS